MSNVDHAVAKSAARTGLQLLLHPRLEPLCQQPARLFDRAAKGVELGAGAELEQPVQVELLWLGGREGHFVIRDEERCGLVEVGRLHLDVLLRFVRGIGQDIVAQAIALSSAHMFDCLSQVRSLCFAQSLPLIGDHHFLTGSP